MTHLYSIALWFMLYSMFGWLYETVVCSIRQRRLVERGFLYGPYCPIYGCGALGSMALLGWTTDPVLLFVGGMVLAAPLEYATGSVLERCFHKKLWDYSRRPGNIKGRICPLGLAIFGVLSWLLVDFVQPAVSTATAQMPPMERALLACTFMAVFLIDAAASVKNQAPDDAPLRGRVRSLGEAIRSLR